MSDPHFRHLTVMFCDLVGSTSLSEEMEPEEYRNLIRYFRDISTQTVFDWTGYVARYMGDGLLAYFGFPHAREDDPHRAAICGIEIIRRLTAAEAKLGRLMAAKIGIATGTVIAGDLIGTGASHENEITGLTANLAARLQAIAEANTVAVSDNTYRLIRKHIQCRDLGEQCIKGISKPQHVWQLVGERVLETRFDAVQLDVLTKFVGRDEEMNALVAAWQRAKAGETQVAIVSGEAGIGKSRLAAAFHEQIRAEAHTCLRFQCSPYHTATALYPVVKQLRAALCLLLTDDRALQLRKLEAFVAKQNADPVQLVPLIAAALSIPVGDEYRSLDITPKRQRDMTFEALLRQLTALATRTPVVCVLEDAQWLDPTTKELLQLIVDNVKARRVLLLVTGRSGSWIEAFQRSNSVSIVLKGLSEDSSREIVRWIVGRSSLPCADENRVVERGEGNPLFVEELARHIAQSIETRSQFAGRGSATARDRKNIVTLPESLADTLMSRIDSCGEARKLLEFCAVVGRETSAELLSVISPFSDDELRTLLSRAVDAGLLRCYAERGEANYSFAHALFREAVYASLLTEKRRLLHEAAALAIEKVSPEIGRYEPETVALHYLEAENCLKALPYVLAAGQRAIEGCAHTEAIHFLERGLDCLLRSPEGEWRVRSEFELRCMLARVHIFRSSWAAPEVEEHYVRALALSDSFSDRSSRIPVVWGLATSNLLKGRVSEAVAGGAELVTLASSVADPDAMCVAHSAMTIFQFHTGDFRAAIEHMEKSLSHYRPHALSKFYLQYATDRKGQAMRGGSLAHWCLGNTGRAIELDCEQREQAFSRKNSFEIAYALGISCLLYSLHRETKSVIEFAGRALDLARHEGFGFRATRAEIFLELARAAEQPSSTQLQACAKLIESYVAAGNKMGTGAWLVQLADLWTQIGGFQQAQDCIDRGLAYVQQSGERFAEAELYRVRGNLLLARGDAELGERSHRDAISVAQRQHAKSWELRAKLSLAKLLRDRGQCQCARDMLLPIFQAFDRQPPSADLAEARALLDT